MTKHLDREIALAFTKAVQRYWDVRLGYHLTALHTEGDAVCMTLDDGSALEADLLLVATGRVQQRRPARSRGGRDRHPSGRTRRSSMHTSARPSRTSGRWAT